MSFLRFPVLLIAGFLLSILVASCGGGSSENGMVNDQDPPDFRGIVLLVSGSPSDVQVAWMPASDDITDETNILYELHFTTMENFSPDNTSLYDTYIGRTSAMVEGLDSATRYYFKMVAVDEAGNQETSATSVSVTTSSIAVVRSSTDFAEADDLNLGAAVIDSSDSSVFRFTTNSSSVPPAENSVLIGVNSSGEPYLRIVDAISQDGNTLILETSNATLSDLVETAAISSEVVLREADTNTGGAIRLRASSRRGSLDQLEPATTISNWENDLLTIVETDRALSNSQIRPSTTDLDVSARSINVSADEALTLTGTIEFEPSVRTDVELINLMINSADVTVSGTLSMDIVLEYDYNGVASVTDREELFSRTYLSRYNVGLIPVWQETTLTLEAVFTGEASAAVHAESSAGITSTVSVNAVYDGNAWTASTSDSFDRDLVVRAESHGTASAEVRIIPTVHVRFYSVASSAISIESFTRAEVEARAVAEQDLIDGGYMEAFGFESFDAFVGVDVNVMADLSIFGYNVARFPETGTENLYSDSVKLFGLPSISATVTAFDSGGYLLQGAAQPFINPFGLINQFDNDSAQWALFPNNDSVSGMNASWTGERPERVFFIGNSEMLGPIGRQYVEAPVPQIEPLSIIDLTIQSDGSGQVLNLEPGTYEMKAISGGWNPWGGTVSLPEFGWVCNAYLVHEDFVPSFPHGGIGSVQYATPDEAIENCSSYEFDVCPGESIAVYNWDANYSDNIGSVTVNISKWSADGVIPSRCP